MRLAAQAPAATARPPYRCRRQGRARRRESIDYAAADHHLLVYHRLALTTRAASPGIKMGELAPTMAVELFQCRLFRDAVVERE